MAFKSPYSLLPQSPVRVRETVPARVGNYTTNLMWILLLAIWTAIAILIGRFLLPPISDPFGPLQITGSTVQTFEYNSTFPSAPTPATNAAWSALFPWQNGFFKHPHLAPERSGLALFHQLHCLNGIRHGYHALLSAQESNSTNPWEDMQAEERLMTSPGHVMHCMEYIRQALMCHADTNIEPVLTKLHGVRGFGVSHTCRDYNEVVKWVKMWEGWN